jgi:hypothetical protein
VQPLPGATAVPPPRPAWIKYAAGGLLALVAAFVGLGTIGYLAGDEPAAPVAGNPQPETKPAAGPGPTAGGGGASGGSTDEGFPIIDAKAEPTIPGKRIDGDANTLLATFGLRFGQETYTYQAAVDFTRGDNDGAGLIKVFKGGRESATDLIKVTRAIQSNGYLGFTVSGALKGNVSAPAICVSALVGKTPGRFDLGNGGGLVCAFATKPGGVCDGDVKIGCANLAP